jgi:hypothetical protein
MTFQAIRYGWNRARLWVWAFLLSSSVTWHEQAGHQSLHLWWHNLGPQAAVVIVAATVLSIVINIISMWAQMGITSASVKAAYGENIVAGDFFLAWEKVGRYILGAMLCGLIVAAGMIAWASVFLELSGHQQVPALS